MLALFNFIKLLNNDESVIQSDVWRVVNHTDINSFDYSKRLLIITSDLLLKFGLISKVNNLSSKILPEAAQNLVLRYNNFINNGDFSEQATNILIADIKGVAATFFNNQQVNFDTNLRALRYTNSNQRGTMKHLLYILYNKGQNSQISDNKLSLEHIEPQTSRSTGYFINDDRDSFVNGLGNIVLIGQSKNSQFSNSTVAEKLVLANSDDFRQDALVTHRIFSSLNSNLQVDRGAYGEENFELLRRSENFDNGIPTINFFNNRMTFYSNELNNMLFSANEFLITGLPY
jgi:hypothetical protein